MSIASPSTDMALLHTSQSYCEQLTREQAKNFYYGLKLLPREKRLAMFALYAYMRRVDDIADADDGRTIDQRLTDLESWRAHSRLAIDGHLPDSPCDPLWCAWAEAVRKYRVPSVVFEQVIEGQRQDLAPKPFANFEDLEAYCYKVAGVVGLGSIHIWGFDGGEATETLAIDRGTAFQLTNILRDLREDSERGRVYLPADELAAMNISREDLQSGGTAFGEMMRFQIDRAESYYQKSAALEQRIQRDARPTLRAMTDIYRGLLEKIAADPQRVLSERVSLSVLSKLRIGWRAVLAG